MSTHFQNDMYNLFTIDSADQHHHSLPPTTNSYHSLPSTTVFWVESKASQPPFMGFEPFANSSSMGDHHSLSSHFDDQHFSLSNEFPSNPHDLSRNVPWANNSGSQKTDLFQSSHLSFHTPSEQNHTDDYLVHNLSSSESLPHFGRRKSVPPQPLLPTSDLPQDLNNAHLWGGSPPSPTSSASPSNNCSTVRPFKCVLPECGKSFTKLHNLKSHARIHMTVKPFKCEYCSYSFRRNHDLKRHTRLHTGVKPFQCKTCCRSFSRSDALKRHIRVEACGNPSMDMNSMNQLGL
jgi:uncharacterized Zn-finger protein